MATEPVTTEKKRMGRKFVRARESAGLTQRVLAERLVRRGNSHQNGSADWHKAVVSMERNLRRYENGHNMPSGALMLAIADELGVEPSHFNNGDDEEDEESAMRRVAAQLIVLGHDDLAGDLLALVRRNGVMVA